MTVGDSIPKLIVATTQNEELDLQSLKGQALVLYFYPKDNTPGCTTEGQNFRDAYNDFKKSKCEILGVSRESIKSHQNFINNFVIFISNRSKMNRMTFLLQKVLAFECFVAYIDSVFAREANHTDCTDARRCC